MTAPYGYPPQAPPAFQPPAQYPPQQFPPAQFQQPAYPPQQFGAPPAPGYPPVQLAPPAPALAQGSIDDFYNQPSVSGGPSWTFKDKQIGFGYAGIVERALTNGDIQQQTIPGSNQPATYRDGRPKFVMKVPMLMQPDAEHPEGKAVWYVTGQARDELVRAMAEAGAPAGPPEQGAGISVQLVARRPSRTPGFNPSNQVVVVYQRPNGAAPAPAVQAPVQQAPAQPVQYAQPAPDLAAQQAALNAAVQAAQQPQYAAPQAPAQPVAQTQPPAAVASPVPPADLSPEQQALLARLTGG